MSNLPFQPGDRVQRNDDAKTSNAHHMTAAGGLDDAVYTVEKCHHGPMSVFVYLVEVPGQAYNAGLFRRV